jgi:hypothetical protein
MFGGRFFFVTHFGDVALQPRPPNEKKKHENKDFH